MYNSVVLHDCKEVTAEDLAVVVSKVGKFAADNRAGINKTLHRVSALRSISDDSIIGLTIRIGRAIYGPLERIADVVYRDASVLLIGFPGVGKTTVLREFARILSLYRKKRVMIVDTSSEIAGSGDIPHAAIGSARRIQVPSPQAQKSVMLEAVQNHTPQVLIVDEIGTSHEVKCMRSIANRGVRLIATVHAMNLAQLVNNTELNGLVGGVASLTLGDRSAEKSFKKKSSLQRQFTPVFDIAIELTSRDSWLIHLNVANAVDNILSKTNDNPLLAKTPMQNTAERRTVITVDNRQLLTTLDENVQPHRE